jgi:DNA-binding LacI/PurR family transcriptional regulator/DNA-binding transcriptional regulator YhcF (GntR family)
MATGSTTTPRVAQLADRLIEDIQVRELQPGDRFLTTAEASKLLGVGSSIANRALQLLERRRVITRQQRSGAFIAGLPLAEDTPMFHRVHFLVHQKYLRAEGVGQDEVLLGIEHELPGVPVQISFLPSGHEAAFVAELVQDSVSAKRVDGFVLVRAPFEAQRLLSERKIPSVVYGVIYASIDGLASLSADMRAVGSELTNFLLNRGHQRIAHFSRQIAYRGDQLTIDGIMAALNGAGRGFDALRLRFMPDSDDVYLAEAEKLFAEPNHPTGFICRTVRMADAISDVATARGLVVGTDVDITVCEYYVKSGSKPRYIHAKALISSEEQGRHLARLLISQVDGRQEGAVHEVIPIKVEIPLKAS